MGDPLSAFTPVMGRLVLEAVRRLDVVLDVLQFSVAALLIQI